MSNLRARAAAAAGTVATRDQAGAVEQAQPEQSLAQLVNSLTGEIARALPKHINADRMARIVLTALRKTPKLALSTRDSFLGAILTSAQLGLEVNTPSGEAYLVPYEDRRKSREQGAPYIEAQLIVGYQGWAKLFLQSPQATHLATGFVRERDLFDYDVSEGYVRHKRNIEPGAASAPVVAYWAKAELAGHKPYVVVLTADEVKELRRGKVGSSGDIADPQRWMERKVALRQALKLLPKSPELARALEADENIVRVSPADLDGVRVERLDLPEQEPPLVEELRAVADAARPTPERPVVDVAPPVEEQPVVEDPPEPEGWAPADPQAELGGIPTEEPESPRERALRVGREARERATGGNG